MAFIIERCTIIFMKKDAQAKRDEALSFLVNHDTGVLATIARTGEPHARLIYYICDDSFNIYFITLKKTRKFDDLCANPRAAFVVSETEIPRTLQIEGTAADVSDTATLDPLVAGFIHRLMEHKEFGIPIAHFDPDQLRFYKLTSTWVRWGDFTFGKGTDEVLTQIEP